MIIINILIAFLIAFLFYRKTIPGLSFSSKIFLGSLRFFSVLIILFLLTNPVLKWTNKKVIKDKIIILKDNSESILKSKENKQETINQWEKIVSKKYSQLGYDTITIEFADGLSDNTSNTLLKKTFLDLKEQNLLSNTKKIFLLSDGWIKDNSLDFLKKINIPIHTFMQKNSSQKKEIKIKNVTYNSKININESAPFLVEIQSEKNSENSIEFFLNDKKIAEKRISSKNENNEIEFEHNFSNPGFYIFDFKIKKTSEKYSGIVRVQDKKKNIIILTDKLNWDIKFIKDALKTNSNVNYLVYLIKDKKIYSGKEVITLNNDTFRQTNLIIMITQKNILNNNTLYDALNNYYNRGGDFWFIGSPQNSINFIPGSLSSITKYFEDRISFNENARFYDTFSEIKKFSQSLSPIEYYYLNPHQNATVIAEIQNQEKSPAILFSNFNNSNVLQFGFVQFWKWKLENPNLNFNDFINNIVDWLTTDIKDRYFAYSDKDIYFAGQPITIYLNAFDEKMDFLQSSSNYLTVLDSTNTVVFSDFMQFENNRFKREIKNLPSGKYKFNIDDKNSQLFSQNEFFISTDSAEKNDIGFNNNILTYIADISKGKEFSSKEQFQSSEFSKAKKTYHNIIKEYPLYKKIYIILAFILLFSLELFFRKRLGLL